MIKAVFFDWFDTLARCEPPREELQSQALRELGVECSPQQVMRGILIADREYFEENSRSPVQKRSPEEQAKVYTRYQKTILTEAGVKVSEELLLKILMIMEEQFKRITFVLFDDVLSTLETLKQQNLILGLLTNAPKDMISAHHWLGLEPYLNFVVTSEEAGSDKPEPLIFLAALDRAGVNASEAVHIGDQYELDVVGAQRAGITPILIDRYNIYSEVTDCPRIRSLTELAQFL